MWRSEENAPTSAGSTVFKDDRKQAYLNPNGSDRPLVGPISGNLCCFRSRFMRRQTKSAQNVRRGRSPDRMACLMFGGL